MILHSTRPPTRFHSDGDTNVRDCVGSTVSYHPLQRVCEKLKSRSKHPAALALTDRLEKCTSKFDWRFGLFTRSLQRCILEVIAYQRTGTF